MTIDNWEERCIQIGRYMIREQCTVRQAAEAWKISKSTVHKDVTERLMVQDRNLYRAVRRVLEKNKSERNVRGGEAKKKKYQKRETK